MEGILVSGQFSFRKVFMLVLIPIVGLGMAAALTSLARAGERALFPGSVQAPNPAADVYYVAKTGDGSFPRLTR